MKKTVRARFDGRALWYEEPLDLPPDTAVEITVRRAAGRRTRSFLAVARSLNLEGPRDWSRRLEDYLYGEEPDASRIGTSSRTRA